jgi:EpsI family protein
VHEFQGWVLFMACAVILVLEARVLAWVTGDRRPWREVFAITVVAAGGPGAASGAPAQSRPLPRAFLAAAAIVLAFGLAMLLVPARQEAIPSRLAFDAFPAQLAGWSGRRSPLEQVYLDTLMLDDYVLSDYRQGDGLPVNFYVAWYNSQRSGQSAHSPRSCLPGGGWEFTEFGQRSLPAVLVHGQPLRVNRAIIAQGDARMLVYYWFKQRDRNVTNEYAVKWFLFIDAIGRNRTDGALVRLVRQMPKGTDVADADAELVRFAQAAVPALLPFVPD